AALLGFPLAADAQPAVPAVGQMSVWTGLGDRQVEAHTDSQQLVEQLADARPRPPAPAWPQIEEVLRTQVQLALRGEVRVQDAMDEAAVQIDALLAQHG